MNLLYICQANIIRGPGAEIITDEKTEKDGITDLSVSSAGLDAPPYLGIVPEMAEALKRLGYTPTKHTPRKVTKELLAEQDLILCMQEWHVEKILEMFPGLEKKIYTLPEYAGLEGEIRDPPWLIGEIPLKDTPYKIVGLVYNLFRKFSILKHTPYLFRKTVYKHFGKTDPRDYKGVIGVYADIAKEIEKCVDGALERMIKEGLLIKGRNP